MRKVFSSITFINALAFATIVLAATLSVTGTVKSLDMATHYLTLTSGEQFMLPSNFKDPGLKSGEKVKVTYEKSGSKLEAKSVEIMK